jgi:hypothetical protein
MYHPNHDTNNGCNENAESSHDGHTYRQPPQRNRGKFPTMQQPPKQSHKPHDSHDPATAAMKSRKSSHNACSSTTHMTHMLGNGRNEIAEIFPRFARLLKKIRLKYLVL